MYIQSLKDAFPKQCRQWEQYEDFSQKTLTDAYLMFQHLHSQLNKKCFLWGVITLVSKSFQLKGLLTMHMCNPDFKIDLNTKKGGGGHRNQLFHCLLRYNVGNSLCWIIIITKESSVWIKTYIFI